MSQLFIEVQCEELPAGVLRGAVDALTKGVIDLLDGIEHGAVRTWCTPRRLAVTVDDVAEARPKTEKVVMGPPETSAFADGTPTKVAIGFARGKGVAVEDLVVVDGPRGRVVAATVSEGGERTVDRIGQGLDGVVRGIPFQKSMEWGTGGLRWSRPLHRINAVYAGQIVEGTAAGLPLGAETIGHRLADDTVFSFTDEASWLEGLRARAVEPDLAVRKARVEELVREGIASQHGDLEVDPDLLEEVTHLVEAPTLVVGSFDRELLDLPPRLLIKAMKAHQRYFPVFRRGELTEHFVVISNNPWGDHDTIAVGNANVLRARFHDARFFFAEDRKKTLEAHGAQLDKMRWIRGLGSMAAKAERIAGLAFTLAPLFGADPEQARRAGVLCKCDLATLMVGEFGDLQGHMGRLYAEAQGEDPVVAAAIEEHYQPSYTGGPLPGTSAGITLAVAERLDTLVGCFGIGMVPKGSGDPQGLRRAVIGLLALLEGTGVRLELESLFAAAMDHFHARAQGETFDRWQKAQGEGFSGRPDLLEALVQFARTRFKATATRAGVSGDLVDAVLAVGPSEPNDWRARLEALVAVSSTDGFLPIMHTFKRVLNITAGADDPPPAREALTEPAEQALFDALTSTEADVHARVAALDYDGAFQAALGLARPVSTFFDDVMVEADDPAVRAARKGLLLRVAALFRLLADFSRISTR
jgi:glycyl-tRNA synthetase beta chain